MKTTQIERMSWTDFRDAMTETDIIIIPLGVMEEHGPHVPLATDTFIAQHCAKLLGERTNTPVAPVMTYGYAANVRKFPGSTSLDPDTYRQLMIAYCESYIRHGAKKFLFINGHGGNSPVLNIIINDLFEKHGVVSFFNDWWTLLPKLNPEWDCQDHGGYYETSMLLAAREDLVNMDKAVAVGESYISPGISKKYTWTFNGGPIGIHCDVTKFNRFGNVGNPPHGASKELGEKMTEAYIDFNVKLIEEMKKMQVPETKI